MDDPQIRRVRADEWQEYRRIRLALLRDTPLAFAERYDDALARPDDFWSDRVRHSAEGRRSVMYVADAAGALVGTASCVVESEPGEPVLAHVVGVYVAPPWRRRRIAADLMAAVLRWADDDAGAARIRLFVVGANDAACSLYRRLGFTATGCTMPYPPDPTHVEHELVYRQTKR